MSPLSRRKVLRGSSLGLLAALAGCQTLTTQSRKQREIDIENYSDGSVSFAVRVVDETGNVLFEHNGSVEAGTQFARVFTGTPTTIHVRIGEHPERGFDWPTPSCADGELAPKVEISYGMTTSMDDTGVYGRCEAILVDET